MVMNEIAEMLPISTCRRSNGYLFDSKSSLLRVSFLQRTRIREIWVSVPRRRDLTRSRSLIPFPDHSTIEIELYYSRRERERVENIFIECVCRPIIITEETYYSPALGSHHGYGLATQNMKCGISQMDEMTSKNILVGLLNFRLASLRFLV